MATYSKSSDRNAAVSILGAAALRTLSVETGDAAPRDTLGLDRTYQAAPVYSRGCSSCQRSCQVVCPLPHRLGPLSHCPASNTWPRTTIAAPQAPDPAALGGADLPLDVCHLVVMPPPASSGAAARLAGRPLFPLLPQFFEKIVLQQKAIFLQVVLAFFNS